MAHIREQVRKAAKQTLVNAATSAGSRVFTSLLRKFQPNELPCLVIETPDEAEIKRAFPNQMPPGRLDRQLTLVVRAYVKEADGAEDALDDLSAEVEAALHADRAAATLGGLVPKGLWPIAYQADESGAIQIPCYAGVTVYRGETNTLSNAPTVAL